MIMDREDKRSISFPVLRLQQPIGEFYVGRIEARSLYEITWVDIRRILRERDVETYLGIQRPLDEKRVAGIKQYVRTIDATFPTGIIVAVDEACAAIDFVRLDDGSTSDTLGIMTLTNLPEPEEPEKRVLFGNIAKVLDGQHRIDALKDYDGPRFDLNVTIFVGPDISDQAGIFATVNKTQTKVNRSLVYDLFALSKTRSPERTCHEITVALDSKEGSPFYQRIKRLGVATEGRFGETLSQANVVDMIIGYISKNPSADRDELRRGRKIPPADADILQRLIFRNMFLAEKDLDIAKVIWNFFAAVQERWPEAWANTGRGAMLNKTNGYRALMRYLRPAYLHFTAPGAVVDVAKFRTLFEKVNLKDSDFNTELFKPGSSGESALYRKILDDTGVDAT
ncbi:MAG TPA: DGQHR domain-containing protein [Stellaceae bacterium]|nr:DGQHR domain-containing protein [Stellaceae bacterium]